jgi:TolB protein
MDRRSLPGDDLRLDRRSHRTLALVFLTLALLGAGCSARAEPAGPAAAGAPPASGEVRLKAYLRDKRQAVAAGYDILRVLFKTPRPFDEKVTLLTARTDRFARLVRRLGSYRVDDLRGEAQRAAIARIGGRAAARLRGDLRAAARGDRGAEARTKRFVRRTFKRHLNAWSFAPPPLRARPRPGVPVARGEIAGRIAFVGEAGAGFDVQVVDADGGRRTNLSRDGRFGTTFGLRGGLAFSPDGARVAFASARDHPPTERGETSTELYLMNADGGDQRRLTRNLTDDFDPTWSPDGTRLAFARSVPGGWDLFVMNADGSGQRPLVVTPAAEVGPAWSPDGGRIAFARFTRGEANEAHGTLVVLDVATGAETIVAAGPGYATDPEWSPDGRRLVFASTRDDFGDSCFHDCLANGEIYVANADGSGATRVTRNLAQDVEPAFAPDGALIAWSSDRDRPTEDFQIYVMNADGTCPRRVTAFDGWERSPAWQPSSAPTGAPLRC